MKGFRVDDNLIKLIVLGFWVIVMLGCCLGLLGVLFDMFLLVGCVCLGLVIGCWIMCNFFFRNVIDELLK